MNTLRQAIAAAGFVPALPDVAFWATENDSLVLSDPTLGMSH